MRNYIRHQAGLPIEIIDLETQVRLEKPVLHNISLGGLECECRNDYPPDTPVLVKIDIVQPRFEIEGKIVWCSKDEFRYDIGIQFSGAMDLSRLQMVEQISHIEHYRKEVKKQEGRQLTGEEAAREWISLHAGKFL